MAPLAAAEDKPAEPRAIKYQIAGMFAPDRGQDLRVVFEKLPQFKLVSIDYRNAEATVEFDPAKVFPGAKPEQIVDRFNEALRSASQGTFEAMPPRTIPMDKLKLIEIPVEGLDCKGCSYGAYLLIYKLPGVELATASFKVGKITALVDPEKIDQAAIEAALKKGGVQIKSPTN
jgi:copper chaperone CopZ